MNFVGQRVEKRNPFRLFKVEKRNPFRLFKNDTSFKEWRSGILSAC